MSDNSISVDTSEGQIKLVSDSGYEGLWRQVALEVVLDGLYYRQRDSQWQYANRPDAPDENWYPLN